MLKCEAFLENAIIHVFLEKGTSTEMCLYVLMEMIKFYKSSNISVFVTF